MIRRENFVRFHGLVLRILRPLAPGGMADILLCEEVTNKGKFVLKSQQSGPATMSSYTAFINDPNFKCFKDEVIAYVQLIHPNIVDFYGFEIVRGIPRILLAFVDGGTLADWISSGKMFDLKTTIKTLIQIAIGLQFAHEHGLVHRDLKPSNILMKENSAKNSFISKISDFGIVKISLDSSLRTATFLQDSLDTNKSHSELINLKNTKPNPQNINEKMSFISAAVGTLGYGSPEQFHLISGAIDRNTDVFSFAIIATELLSKGYMPRLYRWFQSGRDFILDPKSLVSNVDKYIRDHFLRYNPNCPPDLIRLIIRCLVINPADRWKAEKQAGEFAYFDTIVKELRRIYRSLFNEDYEFFEPDMTLNDDLRYIYRAKTLKNLGYSEDETKVLFDKAFSLQPLGFEGWSNRSKLLLDAKKPEEAFKAAIKAISLNDKNILAWYNKGNALDEMGESEQAIDAFNEAIKIDPTYSLSYYYKAKTLSRLQRYDEAINSFCKALEIDEYDINSWYDKEKLLFDLQLYENALECLEKIINIDPNHADAWFRKGEVQRKLNNTADAIICFDKVIELENSFDAWASKGTLLRVKVRNILKVTHGHLTLAQFNEILELFNNAKISYDEAIHIEPNDGLLYFERAALYIEQTIVDQSNKDPLIEKGLEDLKKAIQLDPHFKNKARSESIFRIIFEDPRFKELIA